MESRLPNVILDNRRSLVIAVHLLLWATSFMGAFLLRFDGDIPAKYLDEEFALWLVVLLATRVVAFSQFGLFHGMWKYTGSRDLESLLKAATVSSVIFGLGILLGGFREFPRSILIIEWLLSIMLVGGLRFGIRIWIQMISAVVSGTSQQRRLLVVGAGDAGEMLVREMYKTMSDRYRPVGFVDDDRRKVGAQIHGVPVLDTTNNLPELVARHQIQEVIIAVPSATGREMRRIVDLCQQTGVSVRTVPSLDRLIDGRVSVNQIRNVAIEDLLGREPVTLDSVEIVEMVREATVLITGAGGSIGSEMCRQVARFKPGRLVLVEQAENSLYHIHRELIASFPDLRIVPCIGDICDRDRMDRLFTHYRPKVVFHAAAHKHVPMMEWNPGEAVKNNVLGTRTITDAADRAGVERFVMISTDKAVNPTSVMGACKRVAEMYAQALSQRSQTRFVTVRFGNVLGSAGSVVPLFQEQIAKGGPVTITHPDMQRYFMTIPEASQLVLQAGAMGDGGEIFVLDMGEPVKIISLARDLITLSGLRPDEDIEIAYSGLRPGEKLFEELSIDGEAADKTKHPKIYVGKFKPSPWDALVRDIDALLAIADIDDAPRIRAGIQRVVPEYKPTILEAATTRTTSGDGKIGSILPLRRRKSGG